MDSSKLLASLKSMKGTPEKLPDWPFSEAIIEGLVANPAASAKYIEERLTRTFADRDEIGEHIRAFCDASGISRGNLDYLNIALKLKTKPTQKTLDREAYHARIKRDKLDVLAAVCEVITGAGSPMAMEAATGIGHRGIYNNLKRALAEHDLVLEDLKRMSMPKRQALANRVHKDWEARINAK